MQHVANDPNPEPDPERWRRFTWEPGDLKFVGRADDGDAATLEP
jgi:hypothetical protein